jgi:hypothetical protein
VIIGGLLSDEPAARQLLSSRLTSDAMELDLLQ